MSPLFKNKSEIKKNDLKKYCIISGLMAFGIMIFVYLCHSNSLFFGDKTVLRMDLYHQYGPLYAELYDRVVNGYSLIYSWTSGLGGGFLGNLFNYCCSPFALIIFLFGHKNMPEAIAVMILLKAVFSSVSFTYYLNKSNRQNNIISTAFGVLYAFCGFFVAYSWNIMWLDAMTVFPLLILGIEKIIDDKKISLFVFSLTYTMITNYYMAYMVCILAVIYFLFYYFGNYTLNSSMFFKTGDKSQKTVDESSDNKNEADIQVSQNDLTFEPTLIKSEDIDANTPAEELIPDSFSIDAEKIEVLNSSDAEKTPFVFSQVVEKPKNIKKPKKKKHKQKLSENRFWITGWSFAGSAVLCFLLSAFALLPVYYCLQTSSATSSSFPESMKTYFNMFEFIANHLPAVEPTIRSSGDVVLPNVYCGLLTVLLIPFYFLSSKIRGRQKVAAVCFIGLFFLGFSINYLNYIWHGFHFPNDLPYRYSFAYSFLLLILAYKVILNISEITRKQFIAAGIGVLAFVVLLDKFGSQNVDRYTIVLTIVFTLIYIIVGGYYTSRRYYKSSVAHLLIFVIIVEICFANTGNYTMSQSKEKYTSDYNYYRQLKELVEEDENELFYRTELSKLRARMDPCWYGYNGVSTFSSMAYEHTSHLMEKLGLFGNDINSYTYYPQTPVFNSMFSLKYIYDNMDMLSDGDIYSFEASNDSFDAYSYNYYLPVAFSVSSDIKNWNIAYSNPFDVQNDLTAVATKTGDCLEPVEATSFSSENISPLTLSSINSGTSFSVDKENTSAEATVSVYIDVETPGEYYVYAGSTKLSSIKITADDFSYNYISSSIQPFIIGVGKQDAGSRITVEYHIDSAYSSANLTFCAAKLNESSFKKSYNRIIKNGTINLTSFDDTYFSGTINVTNDDGFLFTSVPYDESWQIKVDGKLMSYYDENKNSDDHGMIVKVGGGLIGFDIDSGEHTISFEYRAKGLALGLLLTLCGVVILLILFLVFLLKKRRNKKLTDAAEVFSDSETPEISENIDTPVIQVETDSQNITKNTESPITPDETVQRVMNEGSDLKPEKTEESGQSDVQG